MQHFLNISKKIHFFSEAKEKMLQKQVVEEEVLDEKPVLTIGSAHEEIIAQEVNGE